MWPIVGHLQGPRAVGDHFAAIFAAVPDFHIEIQRMAADGETVFAHWHAAGTFTGKPFLGIDSETSVRCCSGGRSTPALVKRSAAS